MAQVISSDIEALRTAIAGQVLLPEDPGYDEARTVWNADIDRHPAVVVRCTSASDVSAAVGFARRRDLEIAVRGGAHSTAGNSVVEGGLQLDLSGMRDVTVDPVARRAVVGGGATLGDVDAAAQAHGLAVPRCALVRGNIAFDVGLRGAQVNDQPLREVRFGVTLGFPVR